MDFARREGKLMLKWSVIGSALAIILAGCYYDSVEGLNPGTGYTNPCDSTQLAIYSQAISTIISYNCLSCHNSSYAGGNVTLDSYDQVKQYCENGMVLNAIQRKSGTNPMPPTSALADCQTQKIILWINNNYPQ
jgi:hypothetical protein